MSSNALVNGTVYKVGKDGITPTIGDNENWYLGDSDTGKPSRGKEGPRGPAGKTPVKGVDYFTDADQKEIAAAAATLVTPKTYPVTLTAAGWNSSTKQQAVSFAAASSTETDHLLIPTPRLSDLTAYNEAGILCVGEDGTAHALTFQCETVPTADLTVYVTVQMVESVNG